MIIMLFVGVNGLKKELRASSQFAVFFLREICHFVGDVEIA